MKRFLIIIKFIFLLQVHILFSNFQEEIETIIPGAESIDEYISLIKNKKIGIVSNSSSIIRTKNKKIHLLDTLIKLNQSISAVFAPEHGFLSDKENGALIKNNFDSKRKINIYSLYGKNKKPSSKQLKDINIMIFDLQDVGARFYTYLSTLYYTMEACAENKIPLIILDRPNPNGHYVDGPVLEKEFTSFVGILEIPIVHGMTLGEIAKMIYGEGLIDSKHQIQVIKIKNYNHNLHYDLPLPPSPNLPNNLSINLYPSLCLFEQTPISVGRGTNLQFQIFGNPKFHSSFSFIPKPNLGSQSPKHKGKVCYGRDLRLTERLSKIEIKWLIDAYKQYPEKNAFFKPGFSLLAGTNCLQEQIRDNYSEEEIRKSWESGLKKFKKIREKYLLYP
tara:strand:+ start:2833 stop:4002 length:1170 start_codon:yes stop_codon:yes gene_type:complete